MMCVAARWQLLTLVALLLAFSDEAFAVTLRMTCDEPGLFGPDCDVCGLETLAGYHVAFNDSLLGWTNRSSPAAGSGPAPAHLNGMAVLGVDAFVVSADYADFKRYVSASSSWEDLRSQSSGSAPSSVAWMGVTAFKNDTLFVATEGGDLRRWTTSSQTWVSVAGPNGGITSPSGILVVQDTLLVFSSDLSKLHEFSIDSEVWTDMTNPSAGSMPASRTGHGLALSEDLVYVFGGQLSDPGGNQNDLHSYSVSTGTWTNLTASSGSSPSKRSWMGAVAQGGSLYIFGGQNGPNVYNDLFRFSSSKWTKIVTVTTPPALYNVALAAFGSRVILYGGRSSANGQGLSNGLWEIDFNTGYVCQNTNECVSRSNYVTTGSGNRPCVIVDNGNLYCWGQSGEYTFSSFNVGELDNEMGDSLQALAIGAGRTPVLISVSVSHACVLTAEKEVVCWGSTQNFGPTNFAALDILSTAQAQANVKPALVRGFHSHTCAILDDGSLKCWGRDGNGALGVGVISQDFRQFGDSLPSVNLGTGVSAVKLAGGYYLTCALLDSGSIKCWGKNNVGQLGYGDTQDRGSSTGHMGSNLPPIALGSNRTATDVSCGSATDASYHHCCAVLDNGSVKCWGKNSHGQLGLGDFAARGNEDGEMGDSLPAVPLGYNLAVKIACGRQHSCALLDSGDVKCWGSNAHGQLGLGDSYTRGDGAGEMGLALPAVDLGRGNIAMALLESAHDTSCAYLQDRSLKCWGNNAYGQLGQGDTESRGDGPGEMGDKLRAIDFGTARTPVVACARATPSDAMWEIGVDAACASASGLCLVGGECTDTDGSFSCSCPEGMTGDGFSMCSNVDECLQPNMCHGLATCKDNVGSFECACNAGFSGDGVSACDNVDECAPEVGTHTCHQWAECSDTIGSFTCACASPGFTGDGVSCSDINECGAGLHTCFADHATCTNTDGSFSCGCVSGYTGDGINSCSDVDECGMRTHNCHVNASCTNAEGTFSCACQANFTGDGVTCEPPKLCDLDRDNCLSSALCTDTPGGSFTCGCWPGFSGDGISACSNIDECAQGTSSCNALATCTDTPGSFFCECTRGYSGNGVQCTNIDECDADIDNCRADARCIDTAGSFTCECEDGFTAADASTNPNCRACAACASGKFQTKECTRTADTECTPCNTECADGSFPDGGCTGTEDTVCTSCVLCLDRARCRSCQAANVSVTATLNIAPADFNATRRLAFRRALARATDVPLGLVRIVRVAAAPLRRAGGTEVETKVETTGARSSVVESRILSELESELQASGIALRAVTAVNTLFDAPVIPDPRPAGTTAPPEPPAEEPTSTAPAAPELPDTTPPASADPPEAGGDPGSGGAPWGVIGGVVAGVLLLLVLASLLWWRCWWARCVYQSDARPKYPVYTADEEADGAPPRVASLPPPTIQVNSVDSQGGKPNWEDLRQRGALDSNRSFQLSFRSTGLTSRVADVGSTGAPLEPHAATPQELPRATTSTEL